MRDLSSVHNLIFTCLTLCLTTFSFLSFFLFLSVSLFRLYYSLTLPLLCRRFWAILSPFRAFSFILLSFFYSPNSRSFSLSFSLSHSYVSRISVHISLRYRFSLVSKTQTNFSQSLSHTPPSFLSLSHSYSPDCKETNGKYVTYAKKHNSSIDEMQLAKQRSLVRPCVFREFEKILEVM